ncbi:histone-lysine n-methyltransferase [Stagonosporopsis vannaccii]|nr:histone-lysine n-methyltransferase [Stagonosporopsis vannaccii]
MLEVWFEHIDIRLTEHTGYGLFARKPRPANLFLGEYTGTLVPIVHTLPDELTEYHFGIRIGKLLVGPNDPQPMCWVDATKKGSIFRFIAHSCEPNAEVVDARVGTHHHVLAIPTIRGIGINEAIAIDYGNEWFTGKQRCLCGTESCRNRPQDGDSDHTD